MYSVKRHVAKALVIAITASMFTYMPVKAEASLGNKISADNVKITAKSTKNDHGTEFIMDGDTSTYWESSNHYRWVELDLNGTYNLSAIKIFNKVNGYYNYNIYVTTDGENYEKVAYKADSEMAKEEGDIYNLDNVKASKIRVDVTFSSAFDDSNISEIELYGKKISDNNSNENSNTSSISVTDFNETNWSKEYEKFSTDESYAKDKTINEIYNMVGRVIGNEYKENFQFEIIERTSLGTDVFEVEDGANGKIIVRGNDGVSLASGFNYYLKNYAKVMYNPLMGSNLNMPESLPAVGEKIVVDTPYEHRYSLNFCTYSYTMSFWDWDEYEEFIDWSAMNGFNLILDIVGQEEVLRRTLNQFGYSDEEVKEYISGPGYFAWFYMQNMTSFGGPLPNRWFEDRVELGRQIHDRMQTLGITPVLQGYSGGVPLDFTTKNQGAEVIKQGDWCGFDRPDMLKTYVDEGKEDYFAKVADAFYTAQKEVYGDISNFYAVDPFHEGGNTGDLNQAKIYTTVQNKMIEHDSDAIWVIQHWQGNPSNEKVSGLIKEQSLILDLNSDLNPDWGRFDNLDLPWIWNMIHNFGGRMGLDGQPEILSTKIPEAYVNSNNMKGIGIAPEAINNSPIVYELIGDMIWTRDSIDFREWTRNYIERRYGKVDENIEEAWDILLNTAYKKTNYYYQGAAESVINSRPAKNINSASTWGHNKISYDKTELEKALELFITSYDDLKNSDAFIYDFLDITKQVLANSAQEYHKEMVSAYDDGNLEKFRNISTHFLNLIKLQERVLSTSPEFLVGTWIEQARTMLADADDWSMDLFEFNARALITTWGDYKNPGLKDYSNRQWSGLTEDLYYKRWEAWVNTVISQLEGNGSGPNINWYKMEYEWANKKTTENNKYATTGSGENLSILAQEAMEKYSVSNISKFIGESSAVDKVNIALGKNVEVSGVDTDENFPVKNLTDGTTGTAWKATEAKWPFTLTLDLDGEKDINGIAFAPNQAAGGFPITYKVEVLSEGNWRTVAETTSGTITGTISLDYKGLGEKVRFTFNSTDNKLIPEITEIMVYENEGQKINYENVALNKPVKIENVGTSWDNPTSNITDGNDSSFWAADREGIGAEVYVDLEGTEMVELVELVFEKADLPFKFKLNVVEADGNETTILDKSNETNALDRRYKIDVNKEIKGIRYILTGKNNVGQFPGAWAALAEIKALRKEEVKIESVNVAIDKAVTGSDAESGRPLSNVTDGDESTLWIANGGAIPSYVNVDLGKEYFVENVEVVFEKAGLPFQFYVETIDASGNSERILDLSNNNTVMEKVYNIEVNKNIKDIKVEIVGNNGQGNAYLAWPAIAEIKAYSKPENVAVNGSITPDSEKMSAIIDGNIGTSVELKKEDNKEFVIDFGKIVDISTIETKGKSNGPLKYTIEYRSLEEKDTWVTIVNKRSNTDNSDTILDALEKQVVSDAIRVKYYNETLTLNEIKVYKADVTGKLTNAIAEAEKIYNSAVVGEKSGQYPEEAKNELLLAINSAKEEAKKGVNSIEVKEEVSKLNDSLKTFYTKVITINRRGLLSAISDAKIVLEGLKDTLSNGNNSEKKVSLNEAISNLESGIKEANNVYATKELTQRQIDEAIEKLKVLINDGIQLLDEYSNYKVQLALAKDKVNNAVIGEGHGQYLQKDVDALKEAISKAEQDYTFDLNVEGIKAISDALSKAIKDFEEKVIKVSKDALNSAILNAEKLLEDVDGKYYPSAIEIFKSELEKANDVKEDVNTSQATVDKALENLLEAQNNLLLSALPDKTELKSLVVDAEALLNKIDSNEELIEEKVKLEEAINNAKKVIENEEATLDEINEAISSLKTSIKEINEAFENLEEVVNKEELQEVINKAEAIEKKNYTKESYTVLKNAIKEAKKILNDKNATVGDVDSAIARINNAIKNLIKVSEDNGTNGSGSNGNTGNSENNSNIGNLGNSSNTNGNTDSNNSNKDSNDKNGNLPNTGGVSPAIALLLGGATLAIGATLIRKKK